jgi:hypothetical protein
MDRSRAVALVVAPVIALVIAASALCAAFVAAQPPPSPSLPTAARWLPVARRLPALSREPGECLTAAADAATARSIAIGRAAFRTPLLLGGQAARTGLSCDSCHRNGRGNPDFFIAGVSDAPGTADVTTSRMSSHRGDGVFNPKPIPDLSVGSAQHTVPRNRGRALETFIRGLIVEEFDGPEPAPATLDGLATYLRHLHPAACSDGERPIRLSTHLDDARAAMGAARDALAMDDAQTASLMIASARTALRSIDERYPGPEFERKRDALRAASRELGSIQSAIMREAPDLELRIAAWVAAIPGWSAPLAGDESVSLYAPERLLRSLTQDRSDVAAGER